MEVFRKFGINGGEVLTIKKDPFLHVIKLMSKPNIDIFSTCLFFSCLPHFVIRIQENKEKNPKILLCETINRGLQKMHACLSCKYPDVTGSKAVRFVQRNISPYGF